ncbi:hypothetical protein NW765_017627 [Fusarium oxysporum]|nr:hypothetical protein NW765_017627 [Fusarium oxysporum]
MKIINVAVVGCGELSQVAQLPALSALCEQFRVTYLCDVSPKVLEYCKARTASNPKVTTSAAEACSSDEVDAVVIASNSALHPEQTILALQNNKHVFVEKPVTYNQRDVDTILEAEQKSRATVFVGYMRRYAPAFISAMAEVGDKSKVLHARVRSIVGQNSSYVEQSGMFPKRFDDIPESARNEVARKDNDMKEQALREFGVTATDGAKRMLFWLGALGTHDLSAMREALGPPWP